MGKGTLATVYLATKIDGQEKVALKCIDLKEFNKEPILEIRERSRLKLEEETSMMYRFNHKNVVKLVEVITLRDYKILVLEHCEGGSLYDEIAKKGKLS